MQYESAPIGLGLPAKPKSTKPEKAKAGVIAFTFPCIVLLPPFVLCCPWP
jgi:hypothetical protein